MEGEDSTVVLDDIKLGEVITDDSLGFDEWTSLISEVERAYPDNIEKICSVYDSFLLKFPLCYGYWRKYADHKIRLCTVDKVVEVFEKAVESATYSVAMWVDYCTFGSLVFQDPSDVRRLFKRGISCVGKDYLCHTLWDKYIDFEFSGKNWSSLANIYIQTLRFPTKKLHCYYDGFKKLVRIWEEEMKSYSNNTLEVSEESMLDDQVPTRYKREEISCIIKDLLDPSLGLARSKALQKYRYIGERFYREASEFNEKINFYESCIKRSYFHVKPLDASQLENWHHYLDFAELHGDFDWIVKLYERCLIPCANYPEFWMRYVEFIESKGGREIANFALDRATQIFLKRVSAIHLFKARFKEHIGDVINARATFLQCDGESDSVLVENVVMRANMERRLGNFIAASTVYKEALKMAERTEKCHMLPILYVHFSQLKYMTTDSEAAARDILMDGIKHVPFSKLLIEELIIFSMTHKGSEHINEVDSVVAKAISPEPGVSQGLSVKDREDISSQYLKFVDLCGTLHDVSNAWNRHVKLFPQSVRTTTYHTATGTKRWKIATESRQETLAALPVQPSGGCNSDNLIQTSLQDNEHSLLENHDNEASLPDTDQVPDQRSPFLENHDMLCDHATVNMHQPGESKNNLQENLHQTSRRVSEPHQVSNEAEGASEPILSFDLAHQVSNEAEGAQASLEFSNEIVQRESDHGPKQDLMPPSLEMLSLNSQDSKSPGLVIQNSEAPQEISSLFPTPPEGEDPQGRSLSNRSILKSEASPGNAMTNENMPESQNANVDLFLSSPLSTRGTFSEQVTTGSASPTSSASNQNTMTRAFAQPHMPANSSRNWHQRSNSERNRRDSRFGNRGHSHRRTHQRRQPSPQQYSQAETGSQMSNSRGYSSQLLSSQSSQIQQGSQVSAPANLTAPQAWSMHNMQQQNSSSAYPSQPTVQPGTYPQAQMSQYPMQSNEQQGNVQTNQAYDQMWQYYYYQQQQQFLWQQQQQLQQQPQQQQFMQQYQQQLMQLQYLQQQQQQLPYQQQQQLQPLQQQQLQQQQLMQQQQQPHQLQQLPNVQQQFQQQHLLCMQQQQQQYMLSQMQLQQHRQQQTLLPVQQHEQRQPEQEVDASNVQASQQVQGTTTHTKDTSGSMASPHPQQHSPYSQ